MGFFPLSYASGSFDIRPTRVFVFLFAMMALLTSTELDPQAFQEFLDQKQYSLNGITRYERVFGAGFVSTGGIETTAEFVKMLNLKEGACLMSTLHIQLFPYGRVCAAISDRSRLSCFNM
jgi:hypothetical protein